MGDYTQIVLDLEVDPARVQEIRDHLKNFVSTSYYLNDPGLATVDVDPYAKSLSSTGERLPMATLHVNCSVKYGHGIGALLDFLTDRVIDTPVFAGYERFESTDDPTLIYWTGAEFDRIEVE